MALRFAELTCTDDQWNELVRSLPGGSLFHTAPWLGLLSRHEGAQWQRLGIYAGNRLVGLYPLEVRRRAGFRLGFSPRQGWSTPYLGPLLEPDYWPLFPTALKRYLRRRGFDYVEMLLWGDEHQPAFAEAGYVCATQYTYLNDLSQGVDGLWQGLRCRTHVRKAERNGLTVEVATEPTLFHRYDELATETYAAQNRANPFTKAMLLDLWQTFAPTDQLKLWVVRAEGEPIAFELVLYFDDRIYFWDGVASRQHLKLRPANLSIWSVLAAAAEAGYRTADLVGFGTPGIAAFKKSFGGQPVAYTRVHCCLSPLAQLGRFAYDKGRALRRSQRRVALSLSGSSETN